MAEFDLNYGTDVSDSYDSEIDDDLPEYNHMFDEFDELRESDAEPLEPLELEGEFDGDVPDEVEVSALDEMLENEDDWDTERAADLEHMFDERFELEAANDTTFEQVEVENLEKSSDWEIEREHELERMLKELEELDDIDDDANNDKVLVKKR